VAPQEVELIILTPTRPDLRETDVKLTDNPNPRVINRREEMTDRSNVINHFRIYIAPLDDVLESGYGWRLRIAGLMKEIDSSTKDKEVVEILKKVVKELLEGHTPPAPRELFTGPNMDHRPWIRKVAGEILWYIAYLEGKSDREEIEWCKMEKILAVEMKGLTEAEILTVIINGIRDMGKHRAHSWDQREFDTFWSERSYREALKWIKEIGKIYTYPAQSGVIRVWVKRAMKNLINITTTSKGDEIKKELLGQLKWFMEVYEDK
jgi:hypothetical protein